MKKIFKTIVEVSACVLDLDNGLLPSSFDGRLELVLCGMTKAVKSCVLNPSTYGVGWRLQSY